MWFALYWSWVNRELWPVPAVVLAVVWLLARPRPFRLEPGEAPPAVIPQARTAHRVTANVLLGLTVACALWSVLAFVALRPALISHLKASGQAASATPWLIENDQLSIRLANSGPQPSDIGSVRLPATRVLGLTHEQALAWRGARPVKYLPGHPQCLVVLH